MQGHRVSNEQTQHDGTTHAMSSHSSVGGHVLLEWNLSILDTLQQIKVYNDLYLALHSSPTV